jgi:hypothetical protein
LEDNGLSSSLLLLLLLIGTEDRFEVFALIFWLTNDFYKLTGCASICTNLIQQIVPPSSTANYTAKLKYRAKSGQQKYNKKWEKYFPWLENYQEAFCKFCRKVSAFFSEDRCSMDYEALQKLEISGL